MTQIHSGTENFTYQNLLTNVKYKIEAHNEFKEAFDEEQALDFNLFDTFSMGENRTSQILAYFLNPNESHGQNNKFLKLFLKLFYNEEIDLSTATVCCERLILENRQIDIYIQIGNLHIGIENKLWAADQKNQLSDYSKYLHNISIDNYLLLYLTPHGGDPSIQSIEQDLLGELKVNKRYQSIKYGDHILNLVNDWIAACSAENVRYYLLQFKQHIINKFTDTHKSIMTDSMKKMVYDNRKEVETLRETYNQMQQEIYKKLRLVEELLRTDQTVYDDVQITKSTIFQHAKDVMIYKWNISHNSNQVYIQLIQDHLDLYINFYFDEYAITNEIEERLRSSTLHREKVDFLTDGSVEKIHKKFLENIGVAVELMKSEVTI